MGTQAQGEGMKVIRVEEEKTRKHFGYWLQGKDHVSLQCVCKNDGYGYWHEIVSKAERTFFVFDYVIARIYGNNEVQLHHPQYFSDVEQLAYHFERETGQEVTIKVYES
jgi:hypothetical protein